MNLRKDRRAGEQALRYNRGIQGVIAQDSLPLETLRRVLKKAADFEEHEVCYPGLRL